MASTYYHGLILEPNCHGCPLQRDTKVPPDGPIPAKLCFVGENPGYRERIEGRGFVGASGNLLWQLAAAYGIKREHVWTSNAALCSKRRVRLATGAVIEEARVAIQSSECCRRRLIGELLYVTQGDPGAVIVPLGNIALSSLTKRKGARIYAYRGSVQQIDLNELWKEVNR